MTSHLAQKTEALDRTAWSAVGWLAARPVLATLVIAVIAVLAYLPGQTNLPAIDRTEGMVALSSLHVVETGDIWRPRWEANVQRTRPIGVFWAQALSLAALGDSAWNDIASYRLASMLATVLGVLLMFLLGRWLVPPAAALMASVLVGITPIVALHAQLAIAEPLILPTTVVAGLALLAVYQDARRARWAGWLGAFWLALGLSTWFNALAVVLLAFVVVATLALADRSLKFVRRLRLGFGLPLLIFLAIPWLAAIWHIDGGTLYRGMSPFAVLDALEGGQAMKFDTVHGVFVLTLLLGFVPVAHLLGPVVVKAWSMRRDRTVRFLLVWLAAPVIALEIFSNKAPLYTVQAVMPAGALLVALMIARHGIYAQRIVAWPGMCWGTVVLVGVIAPIGFGGILWVTATPVGPGLAGGFLLLAVLFVGAAWVSTKGQGMAWFALAAAGTLVFTVWFNGVLMAGLANFWTAPQIAKLADAIEMCHGGGRRPEILISGFREPSLALRLRGRAEIGRPSATGRAWANARAGYAIVEARRRGAFDEAAMAAGAPKPEAVGGCAAALNLARGCFLSFEVIRPRAGALRPKCDLPLKMHCRARQDQVARLLNIKHCQ